MRITTKTLDVFDVVGSLSIMVTDRHAFDPELRNPNQAFDPDLGEIDPIWDRRHERELRGLGYSLTTIRKRIDCWDSERTEVAKRSRRDGATDYSNAGESVVRASAIKGAVIWRDSYTSEPICTDLFKNFAERSGAIGMNFHPINVSDT